MWWPVASDDSRWKGTSFRLTLRRRTEPLVRYRKLHHFIPERPVMTRRTPLVLVTALAITALSGCGGGGGDDNLIGGTRVTAGAAQTVPGDCPPETKQLFLDQINTHRTAGLQCGARGFFSAVPALTWNDKLGQAALDHSNDMADNNYLAHVSPDGKSTPATRLAKVGYVWSAYGENIAGGQQNVPAVVMAWRLSDGHCANQMNPNFSEVGLACVIAKTPSGISPYWTAVLARP